MIPLLSETDWTHIENILGVLAFLIATLAALWVIARQ